MSWTPIIASWARRGRFKADCDRLEKLFDIELNTFLKKIYSRLGKGLNPNPLQVSFSDIKVEPSHSTESRTWKFHLNDKEDVIKGRIGRIKLPYYRAMVSRIRKQTAALVAAQLYTLHRYATNYPEKFDKIKNSGGWFGSIFTPVRDIIMINRMEDEMYHVLAAVGEARWARVKEGSILFTVKKLNKVDGTIAEALEISEGKFKDIEDEFERLRHTPSTKEMKKEDIFIKQEIAELDHLIGLIRDDKELRAKVGASGPMEDHLHRLNAIRDSLDKIHRRIRRSAKHWNHGKDVFKPGLKGMQSGDIGGRTRDFLEDHAREERHNITALHSLYEYFEHEKAAIISDIRLFSRRLAA